VQGEIVSHYRIVHRLGGGGMGVVYRAEDVRLKRQVALKFLHHETTEDSAARRRLIREARAASALDHHNICTIYEIDQASDGRIFIAMAYYPGETLKARIHRHPLSIPEALDIALQLAEALDCAHQKGIVHRDLKPANVLITEAGVVKLLDFGLAKLAGQSRLTRSGSVVGTAYYMSPEQLRSEDLDHRSDLWSLGVLLHESLTGGLPFAGDSEAAVILSIVGGEPRDLAEERPDVPEEVAAILRRCLAKDKNARYASARQLAGDLRKALGQLSHGVTETWREPRALPAVGAAVASGKRSPPAGSGAPLRGDGRFLSALGGSLLARRTTLAAGALALLAGLVFGALHWVPRRSFDGSGEPTAARPESRPHTLAVLPFANLTGDPERNYIADGLAAVLIGQLGELEGLRVAARTEVWPYRERDASLTARELARELGVEAVLEGEYHETGGRSRVQLSLVDGATGFVLWSRVVEGQRDRLLDIQTELARDVAARLTDLTGPDAERLERELTTSDLAYDLFLRARAFWEQIDHPEAVEHAEALLRQALEVDPRFAAARAELASVLLWHHRQEGSEERLEAAVAEAEEALRGDPDLLTARVVLAEALSRSGRSVEAIQQLRRLMAHHPDDDNLHARLALVYGGVRDRANQEASLRRALQLRPAYWGHWNELGRLLLAQGEFEAAKEAFLRAVELTELDTGWPYQNLAALELQRADFAAAARYYEEVPRPIADAVLASNIATTYYHLGELAAAEEHYLLAVRLRPEEAVFRSNLGDLLLRQGRSAEARASYRIAVELVRDGLDREPESGGLRLRLALYLAKAQECDEAMARARALENELEGAVHGSTHRLAKAYALCGEREAALDALERAVAAGLPRASILADHDLASLSAEPRFRRLVE
jgi:eukaryotic-like serine/threonine-protein kinase